MTILPKPFEPAELRSRIKAVLRRTMAPVHAHGRPPARIKVGRCVVDIEQKTMFDEAGEKVALTSMEFDLLYTFITHAKRVLTRDQLLEWPITSAGTRLTVRSISASRGCARRSRLTRQSRAF